MDIRGVGENLSWETLEQRKQRLLDSLKTDPHVYQDESNAKALVSSDPLNAKHNENVSPEVAIIAASNVIENTPSENIPSKHKKRISCRYPILFLLFLVLAGVGVVFGLWRAGKIPGPWSDESVRDEFLSPQSIRIPNDPTQRLILPRNLPNGPNGCSNVPIRPPLRAYLYGEHEESLKSGISTRVCPTSGFRYTITECDLQTTMGMPEKKYIKAYYPHLVTAMERYDINCSPNRISAFLAQVRHETNGLQTMFQEKDGGAGAIHMIPEHFARAIREIPEIANVYADKEASKFQDAYSLTDLDLIAKRPEKSEQEKTFLRNVGKLIARPENTFLTAGWWFQQGSIKALGSTFNCADLRADADYGLGEKSNEPNGQNTGFYQISACIFGSANDTGIEQRVQYYQDTLKLAKTWKCQTNNCREPGQLI